MNKMGVGEVQCVMCGNTFETIHIYSCTYINVHVQIHTIIYSRNEMLIDRSIFMLSCYAYCIFEPVQSVES
jgi:hypothetical protein